MVWFHRKLKQKHELSENSEEINQMFNQVTISSLTNKWLFLPSVQY